MVTTIINALFILSIAQADTPGTKYIKNMTVSCGTFNDRIVVEWQDLNCTSYNVLRSQFKTGPFEIIARATGNEYSDTTAERGIKYWYKIEPVADTESPDELQNIDVTLFITDEEYLKSNEKKIQVEKTDPVTENPMPETYNYSGYIIPEKPAGIKFSDLTKQKKNVLKTPKDRQVKELQKKRIEYLKPYYMHPVKLSIVMNMSRSYIEKGQVIILTDIGSYELVPKKNLAIFFNPELSYKIKFESKKFFKIMRESKDKDLNELLLNNSELYCIYYGISEYIDKNNITHIVHLYDAIGLSTGYLKNNAEWKSNTIMLSTSRRDLQDQMKKIANQGNSEIDK